MSTDLDKAKIVKRLTKHNRVVAAQSLKKGDVVFTEAPTFRYSLSNNEITSNPEVQAFCKEIGIDPHLIGMPLSVVQSEPKTRKRVLAVKKTFPNVKPSDSHLKFLLEGSKTKRRKIDNLTLPKDVSISEFVDALIVCDTKALVLGVGDELGLFEGRSNIRHSCRPNCVWEPVLPPDTTDDASEHKVSGAVQTHGVVAVRDIAEGEELTISYLSERELVLPTSLRQKRLWLSRHFLCSCSFCSQDETRRVFQCLKCKTGGIRLLRENEGIPNPGVHAQLACFECGFCVSRDVFDVMLTRERQIVDAWKRLGPHSHSSWHDFSKTMDFFMAEISLILSPLHWLKSEVDELACELFRRSQKFYAARQFLENRVKYLLAVGVEPHHLLISHYRKLGDLIFQDFRLSHHTYQPPLEESASKEAADGLASIYFPNGSHRTWKLGQPVSGVLAAAELDPSQSYCLLHRDSNSILFPYDIVDQAGRFSCCSLQDLFPPSDETPIDQVGVKKLIKSLLWYKRAADVSRIITVALTDNQRARPTETERVYSTMKLIADKLIRRAAPKQASPESDKPSPTQAPNGEQDPSSS